LLITSGRLYNLIKKKGKKHNTVRTTRYQGSTEGEKQMISVEEGESEWM